MPYLSASAVVIHYEEALYQVYGPLSLSENGDPRCLLLSLYRCGNTGISYYSPSVLAGQ